jgi:hypothetical protein
MRLKVRLTGSWAPHPNEGGPATFVRGASADAGVLQVSWAEYEGGPLPNPTLADLEEMAHEFGRPHGFGEPRESGSGACPFGAFGTATFQTPSLARIQVWLLSNGRDFIYVTHLCEVAPDPAEIAEADEIARCLSLGPGDADAPSTVRPPRREERDPAEDVKQVTGGRLRRWIGRVTGRTR